MWNGAVLLVAMLAGLLGCGVFTGNDACELLPCEDGLVVHFDEVVPSDVMLTLELPDGTSQTQTCGAASFCSVVMFAGVSAPSARLRVSMDGAPENLVEVEELVYERFRPNGEDCPPECLIATITLKVSSLVAALHHTAA
jgi:hypothetical protein